LAHNLYNNLMIFNCKKNYKLEASVVFKMKKKMPLCFFGGFFQNTPCFNSDFIGRNIIFFEHISNNVFKINTFLREKQRN